MEGLPVMEQSEQGQPRWNNLIPPLIASNSQSRHIRYQTPTIVWPGNAFFGMVVPIAFYTDDNYGTYYGKAPYFLFELRNRKDVDDYAYGYTRWYDTSYARSRAYAKSGGSSNSSSIDNWTRSNGFFKTGSNDSGNTGSAGTSYMWLCAIFDQKYSSPGNLRISAGRFPIESDAEFTTFLGNYKRNPAEAIVKAWNDNGNQTANGGTCGVNNWAASGTWNPSKGDELYIDFRILNVNDNSYTTPNPYRATIGAPIAGAWIG